MCVQYIELFSCKVDKSFTNSVCHTMELLYWHCVKVNIFVIDGVCFTSKGLART